MLGRVLKLRVCASLKPGEEDRRPIFAAHRTPTMKPSPVSMRYVEEMMDAARDLRPSDRRDYLAVHGIDIDRVTEYLELVKVLEKSLAMKSASG